MPPVDSTATAGEAIQPPGRLRALIFHVASRLLALRLEDVQEVLPFAHLARPPGLPREIPGLLQLGPTSVPVLRLATLFDLPEVPASLYTPLVILRTSEAPLALWFDAVDRIVEVEAAALVPLRAGYALNECVLGTFSWNGEQVLLLAADRLLRAEQELRLASLRQPQEATS